MTCYKYYYDIINFYAAGMIQGIALPMDIIITIASMDWRTWAKLALADPVFCKWAADNVATFMRLFYYSHDCYTWYGRHNTWHLLGIDNHSWFDYPAGGYNGNLYWLDRGRPHRDNDRPQYISDNLRKYKINGVYCRRDDAPVEMNQDGKLLWESDHELVQYSYMCGEKINHTFKYT
jgi:hypothetical protein